MSYLRDFNMAAFWGRSSRADDGAAGGALRPARTLA